MSPKSCPECGRPLPPQAPGGLCPNCLLQLAGTVPELIPPANATRLPSAEKPGTEIGRYKLLEPIGEGGFGTVWMAEQTEPVRRKVALKIIKLGMDTKEVVARFEAERQALALMDHPSIAHVFDGGATEYGRPYFVMELVKGERITEYCDARRLSTPERLALFIQICLAVQHAHQKGIIHRDLKPSNVLVTEVDGRAIPKVIDFGIAKATGSELTAKTLFTRLNQVIGTPAYMSPEQAGLGSLDVDTRSDVYSLGVLLYELLTGQTPFSDVELRQEALDKMLQTIREKEPPKPSTRLETLGHELQEIARHRRTEPGTLSRLVRGDLDWIVMKSLEKNRTLRYDTAGSLALDIERHLHQEPVLAAAPGAVYRAGKFVRRHKIGLAMAAAFLSLLIAGLLASAWQAVRATRAEKRTRAEAAKSRQVARFLEEMLAGVGPSVALGRDTLLLREILDKTVKRVGEDLTNQPDVEAEIRFDIGEVYRALGQFDEAETMHRRALTLRRQCLGNESRETAWSLESLALTLERLGNLEEAESLQREALLMRQRLLGPEHVEVAASLNDLGNILYNLGKLPEAEGFHRRALAMRRRLVGNEHEWVAISLNNLAALLWKQGQTAEAEDLERESLSIRRKLLDSEHPSVAESLNNLAAILTARGRLAEAESLFREVLARHRKLLGNEHPDVAVSLNNLGRTFWAERKLEEAELAQREALSIRRTRFGDEHLVVAGSLHDLAVVLADLGRPVEAEELHRQALNLRRKLGGSDHPIVAVSLESLGQLLQQRQPDQAESLARECVAIRERKIPDDWRTFSARSLLGGTLLIQQQYREAEPLLLTAYQGLQQRLQFVPFPARNCLKETLERLTKLYEQTKQPDQAAEWKKKLAAFEKDASTN